MEEKEAEEIVEAWLQRFGSHATYFGPAVTAVLTDAVPSPDAWHVSDASSNQSIIYTVTGGNLFTISCEVPESLDDLPLNGGDVLVMHRNLDPDASINLRATGRGGETRVWTLTVGGTTIEFLGRIMQKEPGVLEPDSGERFARVVAHRCGYESPAGRDGGEPLVA